MRAATVILTVLLVGCASTSEYQKHYKASTEVTSDTAVDWLAQGAQPEIVTVEDLGTELEARRAQGYLVIGYSQFSGPLEAEEGISDQARESRATLVLKSVLEEGKATRYRRVYDRTDGVVYEPIVAELDAPPADSATGDVPDEPVYEKITVYRQTALFLARKR